MKFNSLVQINKIFLSPNDKFLTLIGEKGSLILYDFETKTNKDIELKLNPINAITISPDNKYLLTNHLIDKWLSKFFLYDIETHSILYEEILERDDHEPSLDFTIESFTFLNKEEFLLFLRNKEVYKLNIKMFENSQFSLEEHLQNKKNIEFITKSQIRHAKYIHHLNSLLIRTYKSYYLYNLDSKKNIAIDKNYFLNTPLDSECLKIIGKRFYILSPTNGLTELELENDRLIFKKNYPIISWGFQDNKETKNLIQDCTFNYINKTGFFLIKGSNRRYSEISLYEWLAKDNMLVYNRFCKFFQKFTNPKHIIISNKLDKLFLVKNNQIFFYSGNLTI